MLEDLLATLGTVPKLKESVTGKSGTQTRESVTAAMYVVIALKKVT